MPEGRQRLRAVHLVLLNGMQGPQQEVDEGGEVMEGHAAVYVPQGPAHRELVEAGPVVAHGLRQDLLLVGLGGLHRAQGLLAPSEDLLQGGLHQPAQGGVAADREARGSLGHGLLALLLLFQQAGLRVELRDVGGLILRELRGVAGLLGLHGAALLDAVQMMNLVEVVVRQAHLLQQVLQPQIVRALIMHCQLVGCQTGGIVHLSSPGKDIFLLVLQAGGVQGQLNLRQRGLKVVQRQRVGHPHDVGVPGLNVVDLASRDKVRLRKALGVHRRVEERGPQVVLALLAHVQRRVQAKLVPLALGHVALGPREALEPGVGGFVGGLRREDEEDEEVVAVLCLHPAAVLGVALLVQKDLHVL
mmetsp:Transcript_47364/g.112611  ORF Transcript_47364/g.112611 Transcript_47364/m.112611 type:complete len:359 (-) Transcript_47364:1358-2434(-)